MEDTNGLLVVLLYEEVSAPPLPPPPSTPPSPYLLLLQGNDRTLWATHLTRLLASSFPDIRVCRIEASLAGMSHRFVSLSLFSSYYIDITISIEVSEGVPALQVYHRGELVANLVQLHSHIGEVREYGRMNGIDYILFRMQQSPIS